MAEPRERFFRCTVSSEGTCRTGHVRAWDAEEAAQLFRAELEADGIDARGRIEVRASDEAARQSIPPRRCGGPVG